MAAKKKKRTAKQKAATRKLVALNKKRVKKKIIARRKRNPVSKQRKLQEAVSLYERFRLDKPRFISKPRLPVTDVAMMIGMLDAVEYTTIRNGKTELYRHEFDRKSRPKLISSWDGLQLFILGGHYNFTEDGIVDY